METAAGPLGLVSSSRARPLSRRDAGAVHRQAGALGAVLGLAVSLVTGRAAGQAAAPLPGPRVAAPPPAPRQESGRALAWRADWHRPTAIDYAATGALLVGAGIELVLPSSTQDRKQNGGVLFDDAVRDAVVLHSASDRVAVDALSDVLLMTLTAYPFVIDAGLTAWLGRRSPEVAWNMAVIDAEAFAFTSLATGFIKRVADRERPNGAECRKDPGYDPGCNTAGQHYSFLSGHSSIAFTGAGLVCMHHGNLALLGHDGDVLSCVTALTTAAITGMSRIAADKHYATDVIAGAGLGLLSGMVMPYLFYYHSREVLPLPVVGGGYLAPLIGTSMFGATYVRPL